MMLPPVLRSRIAVAAYLIPRNARIERKQLVLISCYSLEGNLSVYCE